MQKVLSWRKGISQYQSDFSNLRVEPPRRCESCGCTKFHKWGTYDRYVIEESGEYRVPIRRFRCVRCRKTCSYLPSFCVSGICYSMDVILNFLSALILKIRFELGERKRRAYALLQRFTSLENLWLVFLRSKGFGGFPADTKERKRAILTSLLEFHRKEQLLSSFLMETGRHFMSAK